MTREAFDVYIVDMAELLGTFEQLTLLAVLGLGEDAYGRSVLRTMQSSLENSRSVAAGAVYATLDRLEARGLLSSRLDDGTPARGGRPRRFYRVTGRGAEALNEARAALEMMWRGKSWPVALESSRRVLRVREMWLRFAAKATSVSLFPFTSGREMLQEAFAWIV